jgi:hypothetical protein
MPGLYLLRSNDSSESPHQIRKVTVTRFCFLFNLDDSQDQKLREEEVRIESWESEVGG